jgi:rhodanese-related sulfurtransferase
MTIQAFLPSMLGIVIGGISGYFYWYYVGCVSGTCPITSNPYISIIYGSILGGLLISSFELKQKHNNYKNQNLKNMTIIDVRSVGEFNGGHVKGSINIPLQEIPQRIEEIKKMEAPIIFCCASGNRSGQATYFAKQQGIDCQNGGAWQEVNYQLQNQ